MKKKMNQETKDLFKCETCFHCEKEFPMNVLKKVDRGDSKIWTCEKPKTCKQLHPEKARIPGKIALVKKGEQCQQV